MTENTQKRIQVTANLAIIITALLLCAVLGKSLISKPEATGVEATAKDQALSSANRPPKTHILPGTKLSVTGVDWAKNGQTLLVAVSNKCHFCTESAPFYQRLARQHVKTKLVAILPQPVDEGRKYLASMNVNVDEIHQAALTQIGIRGTPTLILLDSSGAVVQSWRGRLTPDKEAEVLATVQ